MNSHNDAYRVLPYDRWTAAMAFSVDEVNRMNVVSFISLIDATSLATIRDQGVDGMKPTYTALVIKAISLALREHPEMNRLVLGGLYRHRLVQLRPVDAVVAVERDQGERVYSAILRDTDRMSVAEITANLHHLATGGDAENETWRWHLFMRLIRWTPAAFCRWLFGLGRYSPRLWRRYRGGAFVVTTVGKYGVDAIAVKWNMPLTFTFGEVKKRPIVVGEQVVARQSFYLTLSWHRELCRGAPAARFFHTVCQFLEKADEYLSESTPISAAPGTVQA